MLEASSIGHAQPRHKTINAEVNLLTEWQRQRDTLREQIARAAVILTLLCLLTCGSVPFLFRMFVQSGWRLEKADAALDSFSSQLAVLDTQKKEVKPRIDRGAMHDSVVRESKQFLGHTVLVMNSASPGMAFESVTSTVIGGELTVDCRAQAETNTVAQTFNELAGGGANVKSSILSTTQKDDKLGSQGVGFEYVKRVAVTQ